MHGQRPAADGVAGRAVVGAYAAPARAMTGLTGLDLERAPRFGPLRRLVLIVGLLVGGLAWVQVGDIGDIEVVDTSAGAVPVSLYLPEPPPGAPPDDGPDDSTGGPPAARTGIVVVHGFAGSRQLMHANAVALARAGNVVAVPDLAGHGSNPVRLPRTSRTSRSDAEPDAPSAAAAGAADALLTEQVLAVLALLGDRPEVDAGRRGALGHSMGSGAVLRAGIREPTIVDAVVAVSPTDAPVDGSAPRNLLLLAGELEAPFAANAQRLLTAAGGPSEDLDAALARGDARAAELVPGVEHVTILFSATAHDAAVAWFARGLAPGAGAAAATAGSVASVASADGGPGGTSTAPSESPAGDDGLFAGITPISWWVLHLVAVVAAWRAAAPVFAEPTLGEGRRGRSLLGLVVGAVAASLLLGVLGAFVELGTLAGMLVGPAVVVWFALAGIGWVWLGDRPGPPGGRDLVWGLGALAVLVLAFGAMAPQAWLPFFPIRERAVLILPFALALLPFGVAFAAAVQGRRPLAAFGWWAAVSVVVVVGLNVAAGVVDDLGFVVLIAPALPVLLGLIQVMTTPLRRPWATAIATAGFLGWMVAALFPLV